LHVLDFGGEIAEIAGIARSRRRARGDAEPDPYDGKQGRRQNAGLPPQTGSPVSYGSRLSHRVITPPLILALSLGYTSMGKVACTKRERGPSLLHRRPAENFVGSITETAVQSQSRKPGRNQTHLIDSSSPP